MDGKIMKKYIPLIVSCLVVILGVGFLADARLNNVPLPGQATDADLTTLSSPTANRFVYATSSGYSYEASSSVRTLLALVVGTDVQAYDAQLADVAGLAVTDNNFIVGNGVNFVAESGATARTSLGLGSLSILSTVTASEITDGTILSADLSLGTGTGLDYDDFTTGTVADARIAST